MITNFDHQILSLMHFNTLVRDTLEYTIKKDSYSVDMYLRKKEAIRRELDLNTPLKQFLENNGENGEKLRKQIEEFYEKFYGDDNTIIHVNEDKLEVDQNQAITIFALTLPVREQLNFIVNLHLAESAKHDALNKDLEELAMLDERLYRGIVWLSVIPEMKKQFIEYNKARQEAKGAITPQSNFIQNDLAKLNELLIQSRNSSRIIKRDYIDVLDKVFDLLEETQGKRELREGHTFESEFQDVQKAVNEFVAKAEPLWKEKYEAVTKEFVENMKEAAAKNQA